MNDVLCGQNGLINQINDAQKLINQYIYLGKNAVGYIQTVIATVKNIAATLKSDPDVILRTIQQDVMGILSEEALKDPNGSLAKLLEIKAAYESAGPAVDRIVSNVQAFIKDPLNTPLSVCDDIPNLKRLGDSVIEAVSPAKVPPPNESPKDLREDLTVLYEQIATVQATVAEEELKNKREQTIPTSGAFAVPDVGEDRKLAGRTPANRVYDPKPGDAHAAAVYGSSGQRPPTSTDPKTGETRTPPASTPAPQPAPKASLANPYPGGKQYVASDFAPSKFATTIAQRVNTLDPAVRGAFAAGIQDYIKSNFKDGRDVSIGEAYRSPERSAQLAAAYAAGTGGRAAGAGKSWHNYGAACDLCVYVDGVWDKGNRGEGEYTGRARQSMAKYGLINDLKGDSGHFYVQSFGAGVPKSVQTGQMTLAGLARSKGTTLV